ncbi:MAG: phosphoribosylglycinamide formyltransferase [Lachnospiraceae bacterium]|nr:phosphoribosylglycinamide formyltransferase [Lachnospiraceae bacterium]
MLRVTVLVSGGGTNLQALIDAEKRGELQEAGIVRVISSNPDAYALKRAELNGIEARVLVKEKGGALEEYGRKLIALTEEADTDLVVLAGFLVVLPPVFISRYENKIINIHPSLIPSFCGKGFYGLKVHEEALKRGVKVTGATVHFVDQGCDTGPILLQKAVEVGREDTPEALQKKVMEEAEWKLLPKAVALIAQNRVAITDGKVHITDGN